MKNIKKDDFLYFADTGAICFSVSNCIDCEYRIAAHIEHSIDPEALQRALDLTIKRYPMYNIRYVKGKGCVLGVIADDKRIIVEPYQPPFYEFDIFSDEPKLRVYYRDKTITVEFYHSLTDANGALEFLNTLVACYFRLLGKIVDERGVRAFDSDITDEEFEDGYEKYAANKRGKLNGLPLKRAFQLKSSEPSPGETPYFKMTFPSDSIKAAKAKYNATVHEFLVAAIYKAYLNIRKKSDVKLPVRLQMPINMRSRFDSNTLRNFVSSALFVTKEADFEGILSDVKRFIALATSLDEAESALQQGKVLIKRVLPHLPAAIGRFLVGIGVKTVGDVKFSTNLSNIGLIRNYIPYVTEYDFIIAPPKSAPFCISSCGYKDKINMIISSRITGSEFRNEFLSVLAGLGIAPIATEFLQ